MRVLMLGHSGAGKTTYMASMYELMNRTNKGFKVIADDQAEHIELLQRAVGIRKGIYPPPTVQRREYNFTLYFEGSRVSSLVWADYRSGALNERSTDDEVMALVSDMKSDRKSVV